MFVSEMLDVAVGIGCLYLLLSLVCSGIAEGIARAFAMRSGTLRSGIRNLLGDPKGEGLAEAFYHHPLIKGLYRQGFFDSLIGRSGKPSYVSPRVFALALFDTLAPVEPTSEKRTFDRVRAVSGGRRRRRGQHPSEELGGRRHGAAGARASVQPEQEPEASGPLPGPIRPDGRARRLRSRRGPRTLRAVRPRLSALQAPRTQHPTSRAQPRPLCNAANIHPPTFARIL